MTPRLATSDATTADARRIAFRPVLGFLGAFLGVSLAMEAFLAIVTAAGPGVDSAVWIRCSLVLASSVLLLLFARRAAAGSQGAWRRIRIISPIVVVAVVVIVSIPGFLPGWVRLEQALCGALVIPAIVAMNLARTRREFRD